MARTICPTLAGLFLLVGAVLNAQTSPQPAPVEISLGQSAVPLYAPWKFTIGDSPIDPATNAQLWAKLGFDDSNGSPSI